MSGAFVKTCNPEYVAHAVNLRRFRRVTATLAALGLLEEAEKIAREGRVPLAVLLGRCRLHRVARVRHRVWKLVSDRSGLSSVKVGAIFGVDHTTVLEALARLRAEARAGARVPVKLVPLRLEAVS